MIEKDIEARIIAAIAALNLPGLDIRGAWQSVDAGNVKGEESADAPAALAVAVSPRAFETFGICVATMEVALALSVRADLCPTGAALETYAAPIAAMLDDLNINMDIDHDCGMAVDGFKPKSVQVSGGSGPVFDRDAGAWAVTWNFTLRGHVAHDSHGS